MKKLIFSVVMLAVLISGAVGARILLKSFTSDFETQIETVAAAPEERQNEFEALAENFEKKRSVLSFFVHGESLSEIEEKISVLKELYSDFANEDELRDALTELSVLAKELYRSHTVSFKTVF